MLASIESIDTEVEELVPEIKMEVEVASLEVTEVLAEVPKSLRMPRSKPTPTKETTKDKKGKWPAILVRTLPMRNPPKPTTQEKGEAINLELEEEELEEISMDDEDMGVNVEEVETYGVYLITQLPEYVPLCKGRTKVSKDIDESKTPLQTPLLPNEIMFEGPRLAWVPLLKLKD